MQLKVCYEFLVFDFELYTLVNFCLEYLKLISTLDDLIMESTETATADTTASVTTESTATNVENDKTENVDNSSKTTDSSKKVTLKSSLERYWAVVKNDPSDFTGWTYLLQFIEQQNDVKIAINVFNDFLSFYPYCYGYWRKYAEYLNKHGEKENCEQIYEKGVQATPLSIDLWIHYINHIKNTYPDDEEKINHLFERALKHSGLDFRSDRLWESYIKWLLEKNDLKAVTDVYTRWITVPTLGYASAFEKLKEFVKSNSPHSILSPEEFLFLRNEVISENSLVDKISDEAPPGEEEPGALEMLNQEETKALQEKIISCRREIHKVTTKEALARWNFEDSIKRPYFHVKPLEQTQLQNWNAYLDYELGCGNKERIMILFERCLIACALYQEYWIKYVEYLYRLQNEDATIKEKIRNVLSQACTVYHRNKIEITLEWAIFEEKQGNIAKAIEILENFESKNPRYMMVMMHRIGLEKRRKNFDKIHELFKEYIDDPEIKQKKLVYMLINRYATFCAQVLRDVHLAAKILREAIAKHKNYTFYSQLFSIYMEAVDFNPDDVLNVFNEALQSEELPIDKKLEFCDKKLTFLNDFAKDVTSIQEVQKERDKYLMEYIATHGSAGQ